MKPSPSDPIAEDGSPLRKWAFTIWILAAVGVGIAFPSWFVDYSFSYDSESNLITLTSIGDNFDNGTYTLNVSSISDASGKSIAGANATVEACGPGTPAFVFLEVGDSSVVRVKVSKHQNRIEIQLSDSDDKIDDATVSSSDVVVTRDGTTLIDGFRLNPLFVLILQVIMFSMGTTLSIGDFARVIRMPTGVLVGLVCQFTIMPAVGFGLAYAFGFPPEISAGIVLVGASPSGLASNVMAFIAKADVAMSVTLTAVATLLSPLLTPLLMKMLAGEMISINALVMMWGMTKMVVIPIIGGVVFHHTVYHRLPWLLRVMPLVSMVGIIAMTVLTVAIGRDNLLQMGVLLILVCFLHTTAGYSLGYLICKILRLDKNSCRTIALEVGMQNSGMASAIAATLDKVATLGLAPIVFGPVMNTTASVLANYWRNHPDESSLSQDRPKASQTVCQTSPQDAGRG